MALIYTADDIFTLLGTVSCERDIIELEHYIIAHRACYSLNDMELFRESIETFYSILNK